MKRYIKASQVTTGDIVVTYRNKIIYDGPISANPIVIFHKIRNFSPETNYEDRFLVNAFERGKDDIFGGWGNPLLIAYRNAIVRICDKEKFDPISIAPKEKIDPNTAVIDGERMTAEEVAQEVMSEADNYEYVYDGYQDRLADYAKKVVENGWENTSKDHVPFSAVKYVVDVYIVQHNTRKQNLAKMCRPFINEYMQEDYDRYKAEYRESLVNEESDM